MKTHMLKMHGINIDEHPEEAALTSKIGGVTCDICQKELCSKYFLKVHKQNTHGIYEEPAQPKEPRGSSAAAAAAQHAHQQQDTHDREPPAAQVPPPYLDPNDTNNRYFSHYTEVCPLCERRFKSIKWLKTHMINDHSDLVALRQNEVNQAVLNDLGRLCVLCGQSFQDRVALQIHLVKDHRHAPGELDQSAHAFGKQRQQQSPSVAPTDLSMAAVALLAPEQLRQARPAPQTTPPRVNGSTSPKTQDPAQSSLKSLQGVNGSAIQRSKPQLFKDKLRHLSHTGKRPFMKHNRCSYCAYETPWLSNLYAHEKRHMKLAADGDKKFVCRICHRAYRYNHSLQRHMLSHRGGAGCSQTVDDAPGGSKVKRYRCSKCNKRFRARELCLEHIRLDHGRDGRRVRCGQCNFVARNVAQYKVHINKQHGGQDVAGDDRNTPTEPSSPPLPVVYAKPKGTYSFQPFLITQIESEAGPKKDSFVSSIVYLPVATKLLQPATVTFQLTPA